MSEMSGYKLMWMMVMFDLPVTSLSQRTAATLFRNDLLSEGFMMMQYSVYMKNCRDSSMVEAVTRRLSSRIPASGKINIISITDKQYEKIISLYGEREPYSNPEQLTLF